MQSSARWWANGYLLYVVLATALVATAFVLVERESPTQVLVFLWFTLLAEAFPIPIPAIQGSVSLGFVTIFSTILAEGPVAGILVAGLGTVGPEDFKGTTPLRAIVFNRFQLSAAAAVSGYAYHWLAPDHALLGQGIAGPPGLTGFAVASLAYFLTNAGLSVLYLCRYSQPPVTLGRLVRQLRNVVALNYLALMPLAYVIAVIYQRIGAVGILLFLLPMAVARFSFQRYMDVYQMFIGTIRALAMAMEAKDRYTYGHSDRVARMAVEIGRRLNLAEDELELLQYAGILHDIGKIGVRDEVLNKPGRFTPSEFEEMKRHPVIGARIVGGVKTLEKISIWIRHHHERYDGSGYPDGLKGEQIPLGARIIAAADAFDAMLHDRPYKAGRPLSEVIAEMKRCAGTHFDPKVVDILVDLVQDPAKTAQLLRPPEPGFIEYLAMLHGDDRGRRRRSPGRRGASWTGAL